MLRNQSSSFISCNAARLSQRSGTARRTCARKRKEEQRVWFSVKEGQASPIRDHSPHGGAFREEEARVMQEKTTKHGGTSPQNVKKHSNPKCLPCEV